MIKFRKPIKTKPMKPRRPSMFLGSNEVNPTLSNKNINPQRGLTTYTVCETHQKRELSDTVTENYFHHRPKAYARTIGNQYAQHTLCALIPRTKTRPHQKSTVKHDTLKSYCVFALSLITPQPSHSSPLTLSPLYCSPVCCNSIPGDQVCAGRDILHRQYCRRIGGHFS
jgi:hypothetical protein